MRLGLYLDMRKGPLVRQSWSGHYALWLDRIAAAEARGAEAVWLTEHHFFDDGYLPQPWTFAAAIAARTTRVRIGSAVTILPFHSALHLAEQVALVDILSAGRVELGVGVGYRRAEYLAFEGEFKQRYNVWEQRVHELRQRWGQEPGDLPVITPGPVQRPVPLWGGFAGPRGARATGRLGLGLQSLDAGLMGPYLAGLAEGGHDPQTARLGGTIDFLLADDPEKAWAIARPHVVERYNSYDRHMFSGTGKAVTYGLSAVHAGPDDAHSHPAGGKDWVSSGRFLVGTPEQVAVLIKERTAGLPVSDLWCWADHPGLDEAIVDRHLELMTDELRPLLAQA